MTRRLAAAPTALLAALAAVGIGQHLAARRRWLGGGK